MRRPVAVYDANVLYPAFLRDLLVRLARAGAVAPRWTDRIHDEWVRNVLTNHADLTPERVVRIRTLMETAAPGALVEDYEHHIDGLVLPDLDDRHVLAAAIEAEAEVITFNLRDFPDHLLAPYGVAARHPDGFLLDLLKRAPGGVLTAMRAQRSSFKNPPFSIDEYLHKLEKAQLGETAEHVRRVAPAL